MVSNRSVVSGPIGPLPRWPSQIHTAGWLPARAPGVRRQFIGFATMDEGYSVTQIKEIQTDDAQIAIALKGLEWVDPNSDLKPQDGMVFLFIAFFIGLVTRTALDVSRHAVPLLCLPRCKFSKTMFSMGSSSPVLMTVSSVVQWVRRRLKVRIPYSVALFLVGGVVGYSQWYARSVNMDLDAFLG